MSRELLGLGESGEIGVTPLEKVDGRWVRAANARRAKRHRARVYYRGWNGVLRDTSAERSTARDAIAAVEDQLREILRGDSNKDVVITAATTLHRAGELWLEQVSRTDSGLSTRTIHDYKGSFTRNVADAGSAVRGLTLVQVNDPQRLRLFLQDVADRRGTSAAKMLRSVLSGILGYAVDNGVLETNALRQVRRVARQAGPRTTERDLKRAFTRAELAQVLAHADAVVDEPSLNPRTVRKRETTADLVAFMAGTGVRIAEARAIRWDHLDLEAGRCAVPGTKSKNSQRTLSLPPWLVKRLEDRARRTGQRGLIFSSPAHLNDPDRAWDQSNCAGAVRSVLDGAGMTWAVPHTFRKSVATRLHEAGFPAARISDQLGHADPGFTLRTYFGRDPEGDKSDLAAVL